MVRLYLLVAVGNKLNLLKDRRLHAYAWGLFLSSEKGESLLKDVTINGKTLKQIREELLADFPESVLKENENNHSYYIPCEAYEQRLNDVVGIFNYNCLTTEGNIHRVADRYVSTATTLIEILDDDGNIVIRKSHPGGTNVIILGQDAGKSQGQPKSLKSDVSAAGSESFKNCCKQLFGTSQLRRINNERKPKTEDKLYNVEFLSGLSSGNGNYSASVKNLETDEHLKLMIFEMYYPQIEKFIPLAKFIQSYKKGKTLKFYGYSKNYKGQQQLIFCRPDPKTDRNTG